MAGELSPSFLLFLSHEISHATIGQALTSALTLLVGRQEEHPACKN